MESVNLSTVFEAFDMESIYRIIGALLFLFSLMALMDNGNPKRWGNVLFTGLLGGTFAFGTVFPAAVMGGCVARTPWA